MKNLPYVVVDEETVPITVLGSFATEDEAVEFIGRQADFAKVFRGGYGIDGPPDDD